jgi:UDPglucose 6-dehydrogenase
MTGKSLSAAVIGLGKVGLPLAVTLATRGVKVAGHDKNAALLVSLREKNFSSTEPGLIERLDRSRGMLEFTDDCATAIRGTDASFVIVPTPTTSNGSFDHRTIIDAVRAIGGALRGCEHYHCVVIVSTVMPGATGGVIKDALEQASALRVGNTVGLCYRPEFIALGSVIHDILQPDIILIGESDSRAGDRVEAISAQVVENEPDIRRMNLINAELTKLAINTFVTTKISYANMIADLCERLPGADSHVVASAVGSDSRIGTKYLRPAIGYGGPCFPRDNKALSALASAIGADAALARATDDINDRQVGRILAFVERYTNSGDMIAVMGLAYKTGTDVVDCSQGISLATLLSKRGYRVVASDPLAGERARELLPQDVAIADMQQAISDAAVVVIMTPWPEYRELRPRSGIVIDPWRIVPQDGQSVQILHPGRAAEPLNQSGTSHKRHANTKGDVLMSMLETGNR